MAYSGSMSDVFVSVVVNTFNSSKFITETVSSIVHQSYQNFEIIVVDDCSTNGTVDLVKSYDDKRLQIIQLDANGGPAKPRNIGVVLQR